MFLIILRISVSDVVKTFLNIITAARVRATNSLLLLVLIVRLLFPTYTNQPKPKMRFIN